MFVLKLPVSQSLPHTTFAFAYCAISLGPESPLDYQVFPISAPPFDNSQCLLVMIASIMRLTSLLVVSLLCSFNHMSHAFPLRPQASPKEPAVRRRVAYSVVAVDGGSAAITPAAQGPDTFTLIQTSDRIEIVTAPASSTPLSIETISVTNIMSESEPKQTVFVSFTQDITKTPSPTMMPSSIAIDAAENYTLSSTVELTSEILTSVSNENYITSFSTSTLTPPTIIISSSVPTISNPMANPDWASEPAHSADEKIPETIGPAAATSISTAVRPPPPDSTEPITIPTTSTKTYDDGRWHTSYPVWNMTSAVLSSASATAVGTSGAHSHWKMR